MAFLFARFRESVTIIITHPQIMELVKYVLNLFLHINYDF